MKKFLSFSKRKKIVVVTSAVVLLFLIILIFTNGNGEEKTVIAKTGDFINQVSVSGKVIPSENVELAFKNGGRIERIYYSVEELAKNKQIVKAGSILAEVDADTAREEVHDAEISLKNAEISLAKAKIESSNENLSADLQKAYDDGFIAVSDAFIDLAPTITGLEDLLGEDNVSNNTVRNSGQVALSYKVEADKLFYKAKTAFEENRKNFRLLDRNSSKESIEKIINETYETTRVLMDAIKSAKNLVDYLIQDTDRESDYTTSRDTLYDYTNTINEHLTNLLSIKTTIKDKKDAFQDTGLEIESLLLSIKQKENALSEARNRLSDYYIRAPFDGIITKIDAKVGEIAETNKPLVFMMSNNAFQIESFIPEVNIAQIKGGDEAKITLDAYGDDVVFLAKVITIDPAETVRDGVSTYKIKLEFSELDERIKSGMTANVAIVTFSKPNTLVIPKGVIYEKNGNKFVQVKRGKKNIEEVQITTGSVSTLGQVEVLSGISDGDEIILDPKVK